MRIREFKKQSVVKTKEQGTWGVCPGGYLLRNALSPELLAPNTMMAGTFF